MSPDRIPLLEHPLDAPTAFTPEALIAAVRTGRGLACEPVPPICALEFDGDLTDKRNARIEDDLLLPVAGKQNFPLHN